MFSVSHYSKFSTVCGTHCLTPHSEPPNKTLSLSLSSLSLWSLFLRVVSYIFFDHEETISQRHNSSVTTNHLQPRVLPSCHHTNLNGELRIAKWDEFLGQMGRVAESPSDSRNHRRVRGRVGSEQERQRE